MDGFFPTLISKDANPNLVSNPVFVTLTTGAAALPVGGGAEATALRVTIANDSTGVLSVDDNGGSLTVDGSVSITGSVTIIDGGGSITVDGTVTADTNFDYAVDSVAGAADIGAMVLAIRDDVLTTLTPVDGDYASLRVDSTGKLWTNTTITNTEFTPLFVQVVDTVTSGEEIHDYDTTVGVSTTDNHDYPVAGAVFFLKSIIVSMSGGGKFTLQVGPVGTLATKAVGFIPKHGGTQQLMFSPAIEVPVASTGTVRIIRENREGSAQDVYSTIIGSDV